MTKAGLVARVHQGDGALTRAETSAVVDRILAILKSRVVAGGRILVTNFGSFEVLGRKIRRGRNPVTGEIMDIRPRRTLVFRASRRLEETLNPGARARGKRC